MRSVTSMDATALNALEILVAKIKAQSGRVIICGAHTQPYFMMEKAGFLVRHHHKTPNIERLDGASAFRKIFGDTYYHGAYVEIRKERGGILVEI